MRFRTLLPMIALAVLIFGLFVSAPVQAQDRSCAFLCTPECPCNILCWNGFQYLTCAQYGICDPNALSARLEPVTSMTQAQNSDADALFQTLASLPEPAPTEDD